MLLNVSFAGYLSDCLLDRCFVEMVAADIVKVDELTHPMDIGIGGRIMLQVDQIA